MPRDQLQKSFPEERFVRRELGVGGIVVVDRELPLIKQRASRSVLVAELAKNVGSDLIVRLDTLETNSPAFAAVDEFFDSNSRPESFDLRKSAVGVEASFNITIRSQDGSKSKTVKLPMPPELARTRNRALDAFAMPQSTLPISAKEREKRLGEWESKALAEELASLHCIGTAKNQLPTGMRIAGELIEELFRQIDEKTKVAADLLLEKLGFKERLGDLPKGPFSIENLPGELRGQLRDQLTRSWKSLGFDSAEQAQGFAQAAGEVELSLSLGLRRSFRGFDATTGRPGSGMTYLFMLVRP